MQRDLAAAGISIRPQRRDFPSPAANRFFSHGGRQYCRRQTFAGTFTENLQSSLEMAWGRDYLPR
ncbi:MAG TPA: hypothetical protein VMU42_07080 [Candidatus Sulfotelmatobacter sp.]|nr:hypothetical protein [Candidatus Sulfotelmatobacter sp.]